MIKPLELYTNSKFLNDDFNIQGKKCVWRYKHMVNKDTDKIMSVQVSLLKGYKRFENKSKFYYVLEITELRFELSESGTFYVVFPVFRSENKALEYLKERYSNYTYRV